MAPARGTVPGPSSALARYRNMTRFLSIVFAALLLACVLPARSESFDGIVSHVSDGDTLWVRPAAGGAPRQIRLEGIDAPEICQAHGRKSRAALIARALHKRVRVDSRARDGYQRMLAHVSLDGHDLGRWLVSDGHAWSYRFHADRGPYAAEEARARGARLGLWHARAPLPPRDFRQRHGSCGPHR